METPSRFIFRRPSYKMKQAVRQEANTGYAIAVRILFGLIKTSFLIILFFFFQVMYRSSCV